MVQFQNCGEERLRTNFNFRENNPFNSNKSLTNDKGKY